MQENEDMKKNLEVLKSNRLIEALQALSLAEGRLIQLAIVDGREQELGFSADKPLVVSAMRYAEVFNVSRQTAYEALMNAEKTLFDRRFTFIDDRDLKIKSRWISQVAYLEGEGGIEIILSPAVVKEVTRIDGKIQHFTKYLLNWTVDLKSIYSVRLYELLIRRKELRKCKLELEIFRQQMGLGVSDYKRMSDFKRHVLDKAVNEINEKTNLKVSYTQQKKGRLITGFEFKILDNNKNLDKQKKINKNDDIRCKDTSDMFTIDGLNDSQLFRITRHKNFVSDFGHLTKGDAGKDWTKFSDFMINEIKKHPEKFNKKRPIREYLNGNKGDYIY